MPLTLRKKNHGGSSKSLSKNSEEDVQIRVYTNWVNDKLRTVDQHVKNLPKDMRSGIILIKLLEVLSGKSIPGK